MPPKKRNNAPTAAPKTNAASPWPAKVDGDDREDVEGWANKSSQQNPTAMKGSDPVSSSAAHLKEAHSKLVGLVLD